MNINMTTTQEADPIGQTPIGPEDPGLPARQPISLKRLEANRRNAQKSTGPLTPAGRAVSSMNALKHGILSKQVLVKGSNIQESSRELSALHERFWQNLNPVGPMEEMLVNQIVTTHWRWQRALTAESGEIALSVDAAPPRQRVPPADLKAHWQNSIDPISTMEESIWGLHTLEYHLSQVRKEVERKGELTQTMIQDLIEAFDDRPNRLTALMEQIRSRQNENPDGLAAETLLQRKKQRTLGCVDEQIRSFKFKRAALEQREATGEKSRRAAAVLPSGPVVDKLVRYETMLERQLYHALSQLERLQLRRQGEIVPPPLAVEVAG
jgi:hypothetical protein